MACFISAMVVGNGMVASKFIHYSERDDVIIFASGVSNSKSAIKTEFDREKKLKEQPKLEVKRKNVDEVILPNLNLKTETVLNLFKDVEYDLGKVRTQKLVKPIYFTQFPRDLDALQSTKLKKETFIKIVLPLIVAENERILADREKLNVVSKKKFTTDFPVSPNP